MTFSQLEQMVNQFMTTSITLKLGKAWKMYVRKASLNQLEFPISTKINLKEYYKTLLSRPLLTRYYIFINFNILVLCK